jgi:hypothetical protein
MVHDMIINIGYNTVFHKNQSTYTQVPPIAYFIVSCKAKQ